MIRSGDLQDRAVAPALTDRQREVVELVTQYVGVAGELPSAAWVGRRLHISEQRARVYFDLLRRRDVLPLR